MGALVQNFCKPRPFPVKIRVFWSVRATLLNTLVYSGVTDTVNQPIRSVYYFYYPVRLCAGEG